MGANALNWAQRKEETWGQYIASGFATTVAMAVGLKDIDPFSWQQIKSKVYEEPHLSEESLKDFESKHDLSSWFDSMNED